MRKSMAGGIGLSALIACASQPPTEHLAASMAAVRGAETAGAAQVPQAALHLQLAEDQIAQAKRMMEDGDNARADNMTIRAYNDADLALLLTREAQLKGELESYAAAHPEVRSKPAERSVTQPLDATNPPGVGSPNTPVRNADE